MIAVINVVYIKDKRKGKKKFPKDVAYFRTYSTEACEQIRTVIENMVRNCYLTNF